MREYKGLVLGLLRRYLIEEGQDLLGVKDGAAHSLWMADHKVQADYDRSVRRSRSQ